MVSEKNILLFQASHSIMQNCCSVIIFHQNIKIFIVFRYCCPLFCETVLNIAISISQNIEREYSVLLISTYIFPLSTFTSDALKKLNISLIRSLWNIWIPEGIEFVIVDYWRWDTRIISIYIHLVDSELNLRVATGFILDIFLLPLHLS